MCKKKKNGKRRFSLSLKMNLLTICLLAACVLGLLFISYRVQSDRIHEEYFNAANEAAINMDPSYFMEMIPFFTETFDSEEFQAVREKAVETNNKALITKWMEEAPGYEYDDTDPDTGKTVRRSLGSFEESYDLMTYSVTDTFYHYDVSRISILYLKNGTFYYLSDSSDDGLMKLGTPSDFVPDYEGTEVMDLIPAKIYREGPEAICRASLLYRDPDSKEIIGVCRVDIKMDHIINASRSFLRRSLSFVILIAVICILLNIFLIRRFATAPLKKLTDATCRFADNKEEYTMDDVIEVDIRSNDEINDLYQEIRSMQAHLVTYTQDLTRLTAEKASAATELQLAANIQRSMLRESATAFPDETVFSLAASMDPARAVGGDFYDFFRLDDNHLALIIADVSGKGIPAALFMMETMLLLKARSASGGTPAEVLASVNNEICSNNKAGMFVTVWMGILDLTTGVMKCANAGHEYPVLASAGGDFSLFKDKHGLVIGAMEGIRYKDYELTLEKGSTLFVYTDGLPEASNEQEEFYGTDRLIRVLNEKRNDNPQELLSAVTEDVIRFAAGAEQFDDLTMLCITYHG